MKMFKKFSTVTLIAVFAVVFVFGSTGSNVAQAATSPSLGTADSFAILSGTPNITDAGGASVITGNVGLSPATGAGIGLLSSQVTGTIYSVDAAGPAGSVVNPGALTAAKNDLITAYDALDAGANADANCLLNDGLGGTGILPSGTDLRTFGATPGTLPSGVYCSAGSFLLTNGAGVDLTLTGAGPWVFKTVSTVITSPGSSVTVATGSVCDVWWRVGSSATLDTTTSFVGNILALTSITMNTGATLAGRALARNGAVTLDTNTITNATCSAGATLYATLRVVKRVINNEDGDEAAGDFTLYVKLSGTNVAGSPAIGIVSPGRSYSLAAGAYVISEDYDDDDYDQTFSGDCNSSGGVTLANGDDKTCTITNDDEEDNDDDDDDDDNDNDNDNERKTTPKLPAAGIGPQEKSDPWNIAILSGILMLVSTSLIIVKRKRTI